MSEILQWIGNLSGIVALAMVYIFKKSTQTYVDEKAKNLATIEDTSRITQEIESVRNLYHRQSHAWKWVFEKEYEILRRVWDSTWAFQASARSLRPVIDRLPQDQNEREKVFQERYNFHADTVNSFRDVVLKNKPFIPPKVYEICLELRRLVIDLQVDFEMSVQESERPDWKMINDRGKKLDEKLEELNVSIREHVHNRTNDSEPTTGFLPAVQ